MRPVRVSAGGTDCGLTWKVANGPRYERTSPGMYVPSARPRSVEQRILEAGAWLEPNGSRGCVTGWAALRWRGASYFDGMAGMEPLPVEIVSPVGIRHRGRDGCSVHRRWLARSEVDVVAGLPVATVQRALFDEIRTRDDLWSAVTAIDMTAAARLISVWLFATYAAECNSRSGAPLVREAVSLAVDECLSPREPWARLVWRLVAGLDEPLVNASLWTPDGRHLARPDLFDVEAGLAGEYQGEVHKARAQHRKDVIREDDLRDHGIEYVEIVAGDSRRDAAARILRARARARFLPPAARAWTLEPPAWVTPEETLDAYFERTGQVERLTRH